MPKPKRLKMAGNLALPQEAVTQTFGFIARKGAGKTYAAGKLAEELYGVKAPFVVLDPVGNWYGLRLSACGRKPGLPIYVFGGDHGDLPITPDSGAIVARAVMKRGIAAVLDVSRFRKNKRKQFVTDFAEELFHLAKTVRSPLMVIIEEAQVFAPQRVGKGEERMLGAIEDIVRLGRNYGLGSALITQRPQSVHKDVLNQVECLFVGQLSGKHERVAVDGWIEQHGVDLDTKGLSSLPVGTMVVWSPQWLKRFGKVRISPKATYDASATPTLGRKRRIGTLAKVDLETLESDLQGVVEEAEAEDPQALKRRLEASQARAKALQERLKQIPLVEKVEIPAFREGEVKILEASLNKLARWGKALLDVAHGLQADLDRARDTNKARTIREIAVDPAPPILGQRVEWPYEGWPAPRGWNRALDSERQEMLKDFEQHKQANKPKPSDNGESKKSPVRWDDQVHVNLPKVERLVLKALAQHSPRKLDLAQVAIFAGYSPKTSSVKNGLGSLRSKDLICGPNASMAVTERGMKAVGNFEPLATGTGLALEWFDRLSKCDRSMLQVLLGNYPESMTLTEVAEAAGYSPNTSSVKNGLGHLRRLKLIEGRNDAMTANEILIS